jgi:crossover junction endodeoxyribonuclease RuvC
MIVAGVDCGLTGAVALLDGPNLLAVFDLPTIDKPHKNKSRAELSPALLQDELIGDVKVSVAFIEAVTASPQMGTVSAFRFGECYGQICAVFQCLGIRTELVRPATWKKAMGLNSDAEVSRAKAIELWPDSSHYFKRKMDHNRAEAALIAEYGRRQG